MVLAIVMEFAKYRLSAQLVGKKMVTTITKTEGSLPEKSRVLRVGYVLPGKVVYSPWASGNTVEMKSIKDKHTTVLDLSKLTFPQEPEL